MKFYEVVDRKGDLERTKFYWDYMDAMRAAVDNWEHLAQSERDLREMLICRYDVEVDEKEVPFCFSVAETLVAIEEGKIAFDGDLDHIAEYGWTQYVTCCENISNFLR